MLSTIGIEPTSNFGMAAAGERMDAVSSFSRLLMGLAAPVQFVASAREIDQFRDWPKPPTLDRSWLAALADDDVTRLDWRTRTLTRSLEGVGLRTAEWSHDYPGEPVARVEPGSVNDGRGCSASLVLRRWPRETTPGWLGQALAGSIPVRCAIHVKPEDPQQFARYLKQQEDWQSDQHTARPDAANALGRRDAGVMREKLIARTDSPVSAAIVLTVRASNRAELKQRVETLRHEMRLALADVHVATFEQDRGLIATQPLAVCDMLGAWRTVDCLSLAGTWPFSPATVRHDNGVDLGTTRQGSMLVKLDPFDPTLEGFSGVIVGKKRMGKSYLMKILARGLAARGVEVTIIEQRNPPEYAVLSHLPNIEVVNIEQIAADEEDADVQMQERVAFLRRFTGELWDRARHDPKPRMLVVDEAWMLLRHARSAAWIETVARTGGHFGLALWILTQQVRELLDTGRAALDNAEVRIFLKQHDKDLDDLCDAVGLRGSRHPAKEFVRSAARGEALLGVGDMWVDVDVARVPQHYEISTDPRDKWEVRSHGLGDSSGEAGPDRGRLPDLRLAGAGSGAGAGAAGALVQR